MKSRKYYLFLILLIVCFNVLGFLTKNAFCTSDIEYIFTANNLIDQNLSNFNYSFNIVNINGTYYPDKQEFHYLDTMELYTGSESVYSYFKEYPNPVPEVQILYDNNSNAEIYIGSALASYVGITRVDNDMDLVNNGWINLTYRFRSSYEAGKEQNGYNVRFYVVDSLGGSSYITMIRITDDGSGNYDVECYESTGYTWYNELTSFKNKIYDFNLCFNGSGTFQFKIYENNVLIGNHYVDERQPSTTLDYDYIFVFDPDAGTTDYNLFYLDSVGTYVNNTPIYADYGYFGYDVNNTKSLTQWSTSTYHQYVSNNNTHGFMVYENVNNWKYYSSPSIPPVDSFIIKSMTETFYSRNMIDDSETVDNPQAYLFINGSFTFDNFELFNQGFSLNQDSIVYGFTLEYSGVNINQSYFYVDSANRLRFFLNITQDDTLEYLSLIYNVDNVACVNRSVAFLNQYNGIASANFRVNFTDDTSNLFEFKPYIQSKNMILSQEKILDSFIITISDLNDNAFTNLTVSGFMGSITLYYYPNVQFTISTINLIELLIPLIILIIPTLTFHKDYGRKIVIPIMIVLTIALFAISLLPTWLFVVMMIGYGALLFFSYKRKGGVME